MERFFFTEHAVNLVKAVNGVARCVLLQGNGTCNRVGPSSLVTNYHPRPNITMTANGAYTAVIQSMPTGRNTIKNGCLRPGVLSPGHN
jgi:hypothetical protein